MRRSTISGDGQDPVQPDPAPVRGERLLSVSAFVRGVRDLLEHRIPMLWVTGEVSGLSMPRSGHWYFTLKDASAQVRCVMFRGRNQLVDWPPRDGMQVDVQALATLYEARGEFQLTVESIRRGGLGQLYERFLALRDRLTAEGLFEPALKRPLPPHPRAIGVVSSLDGAALHDILTTLRRRNPCVRVVIYPASVQGDRAADELTAAVQIAGRRREVDVLILARGGGGIQDLWSFNDERLARAIRACAIPVVSGVGHETDFTIADFAADLRAPTPTAAAELSCPAAADMVRAAQGSFQRTARALRHTLEQHMQRVDALAQRVVHPAERLAARARAAGELVQRLCRAAARNFAEHRRVADALGRRLYTARPALGARSRSLQTACVRLNAAAQERVQRPQERLAALTRALGHLHPDRVLERGYCIATSESGAIVTNAKTLRAGELLRMRFARGNARARVESAQPDGGPSRR
jgi:exodeoxyribonuclease VII large subunit